MDNFPNVRVFLFDDLEMNTAKLLDEMFVFIGVDKSKGNNIDSGKRFNASRPVLVPNSKITIALYRSLKILGYPLSKGMKENARLVINKLLYNEELLPIKFLEKLRLSFVPEVKRLEGLIQRDLSAWKVEP